jgi:membrane protease YdiL (CAAX protease family)
MLGVLLRLRRAGDLVLRGRTDGRLRATWRVAVPILLAFVGITALGPAVVRTADAGALGQAITGHLLSAAVVTGVLVLSARVLDDRNVTDYGLDVDRRWVLEFAGGAALGTALVGATLVVGYLAGWVRVVETFSSGDAGALVPWLALFAVGWLCVGYWEEVLFRGIFITNAVEGLSARSLSPRATLASGWLASAVVFGVVHVPFGSVPGQATPVSKLAFWVLMGGLLGLGYVITGRLALPIGLHAAYDLAANDSSTPCRRRASCCPRWSGAKSSPGGCWIPLPGFPAFSSCCVGTWCWRAGGTSATGTSRCRALGPQARRELRTE